MSLTLKLKKSDFMGCSSFLQYFIIIIKLETEQISQTKEDMGISVVLKAI